MLLLVYLLYRQSFGENYNKGAFFMSNYNKKIIRTASYIEIWEYEKPIFSKGKSIDINTESKEKTKRRKFDELKPEEQEQRLERMKKTR